MKIKFQISNVVPIANYDYYHLFRFSRSDLLTCLMPRHLGLAMCQRTDTLTFAVVSNLINSLIINIADKIYS